MKFLPLLALLLTTAPAFAQTERHPGVKLEVLRSNSARAIVRVSNPGLRRAPYTVTAHDEEGRLLEGVKVSPSMFTLARNRSREVRVQQLPRVPLYLCATTIVSPSLHLRSCVHRD